MGIDSTIALGIKPVAAPTYNPLATLGQFANTSNALIGVQTAQQQLAARQAIGQAYQAAANPDGSVDYGKLQNNIQQNPAASWMAPQIMQGIQEQEKRALELQKGALDQATSRAGIFSTALAPLLAQGNAITPTDVYGVVQRLHAAGVPTDGMVSQIASTMPTSGGAPLRSWVLQNFGAALPAASQAETFLPKVGTQDVGGTIQTYDSNPVTNPGATGLTLGKTLTPDQAVHPVDGPLTASGGKTVMPTASYAQSNGLGGLVPGGVSAFGTGRPGGLPPALMNPNRPQAMPAAASGPAPAAAAAAGAGGGNAPGFDNMVASLGAPAGGGAMGAGVPAGAAPAGPAPGAPMTVALGPGQQAGLDVAGKASADQWAALQAQVGGSAAGGGSAGRIYTLQHAQDLLQQLGTTGTGPSSPQTQAVASYLQSIPGIGPYIPGIDPTNIANYDQANKALTAYASARAGAHGNNTDSQLATTLSSNASTHISNLAAQQVVAANIGLERMDQAQVASFQAAKDPTTGQPLTPDQFSNFSANWNSSMDPRAFVADQLSAPQVQKLTAGMAPAELARFQNTYNTAISKGWMTPPAWAQSAAAPTDGAPSTADLAVNPGGAPPAAVQPPMVPTGY